MNLVLTGVGVWARGLTSYGAFRDAASTGFVGLGDAAFEQPRPASIPARERRRAGLLINIAVEVAHQACEEAGVPKNTIASVFTSSVGDTAITDYMCRKLAGRERLLSPAKFTNSVHNAASGYWTISAENREPSTFVGGFGTCVGAGLLEAAGQARASGNAVLLVAYDVANAPPLSEVCPVGESIAVAFVLAPFLPSARDCAMVLPLDLRYVPEHAEPPVPTASALRELAKANPVGSALAFLERCVADGGRPSSPLRFPASPAGCLELSLGG